jgi:hypothetical protein
VNLELSGQSVRSIALDYAVTLVLDGGVEIRIATAFSVRAPSGQVVQIDPEQLGPGLEHIVDVLHGTVTDAVAQESGTLVLDFDNGAQLEVAPDDSYEAWTLAGSHGQKVVAGPGGELSTWGPLA